MNENLNKITTTLNNLVSHYEGLIRKGQVGSYNKEEYLQLVNFYISNSNIEKALDIVDIAIEQYKYISKFYIIKSKLLLELHLPKQAKDIIEYCEDLSPYDFEVKLLKAKYYALTGEIDKSMAILNDFKSFSHVSYSVEINVVKAYIYEHLGEYDKMFQILKKTLILDPGNIEVLKKFYTSTVFTKKYQESIDFHLKIIDYNPYNYIAWFNLGQIYSTTSNYELAVDSLEYSFLINPQFEEGYLEYSDLCMQTGKYKKAIEIYEEFLSKFDADSEVYLNLVNANMRINNLNKAGEYAFRIIKIDPYNDEAYFLLGDIYRLKNKWKKALNAYQKALELDSENEEYYYRIAQMYIKLNDNNLAEKYFDFLMELDSPEENYYLDYTLFLIKNEKFEKAYSILIDSEDKVYCSYFNYLKAVIEYKKGNKKEALLNLDIALNENFDEYKKIFEISPEMKFDKEVNSMINYYRGI